MGAVAGLRGHFLPKEQLSRTSPPPFGRGVHPRRRKCTLGDVVLHWRLQIHSACPHFDSRFIHVTLLSPTVSRPRRVLTGNPVRERVCGEIQLRS